MNICSESIKTSVVAGIVREEVRLATVSHVISTYVEKVVTFMHQIFGGAASAFFVPSFPLASDCFVEPVHALPMS